MKIWSYFNFRTLLAIALSQVAAFIASAYDIRFNHNIMLFGLAVAFPLHFSIQAAFKRRERALEYLSAFKAGTLALHYSLHIPDKMPPEKKQQWRTLLMMLNQTLLNKLSLREKDYAPIQHCIDHLSDFITNNGEVIASRNVTRLVRYLRDVSETSVFLMSLVTHRTIGGLRFYGTFFILIFPFIQAPILFHKFSGVLPEWAVFVVIAFTSLILISLDNFQKLIEYPFDQNGYDNVRLDEYKLVL